MVVDKNTAISDIEVSNNMITNLMRHLIGVVNIAISSQDTLKSFIRRDDIDIILINQNVAEMVSLNLLRSLDLAFLKFLEVS